MTTGELLIELFNAHKNNNESEFMRVAMTLVEEEKNKNHYVLANKLKKILVSSSNTKNSKFYSNHLNSITEIPKDKDKQSSLVEIKYPKKTLNDIILSEEIRSKIENIITEYHKKDILKGYGFKPKTKILFCGPPGCGKTLCAEVLAQELDLPILYTRFDGLISSYLGETATNIRNVFEYAQNNNWLLFFDEFDAIGKSRSDVDEHGELKRVVNSFLQILDGFESDSFVIAATNHERNIDSALWRRFDEIIYFDKPNNEQIEATIRNKLRAFPVDGLDICEMTKRMNNMSYADIERICVDSIKYCLLNGNVDVTNEIFEKNLVEEIKRAELVRKIAND